jgi:hypothetical protein
MNFREYIKEEFDQTVAVKDALTWLKNKYGADTFTFKHIENMVANGSKTKSYDITIGDNVYLLNLRKFDSNGDGTPDTVGFDVKSVVPNAEPDEEIEAEL